MPARGLNTQFQLSERANRSSMQKILQALSDLGVEERDMATSNFPIHYETPRPKVEGHEGQ